MNWRYVEILRSILVIGLISFLILTIIVLIKEWIQKKKQERKQ
jgi:hypothetical protein